MAMEQATLSSSGLYGGGGERGVGGKFRKPQARRPPKTPYDRPQSNQSQASIQRPDGGWLSKLVDPAYRLIAGGATRIFPSIFSKSHAPMALTTEDDDESDSGGSEERENAYVDKEGDTVSLEISKSTGGTNPREGAEKWNGSSDFDQLGQDKISNLADGTEFSKIEQLVKGRRFSRDELNRLTEILNSRVGDSSNVNSEEKEPIMAVQKEGKGAVPARENPRTSIEEKKEGLDGMMVGTTKPLLQFAVKEEVGASPVDIARAYMRSRVSEVGTTSRRIISEDETGLPESDGFASPLVPSLSPKSSVCWPGAMVQDQRGYSTPQSSRYGLHHFERTPYSRTNYSKSKTELTHSQADKKRYLNILSTPRLQPQTPHVGQGDSLNEDNGSAGPIRRARRKFVSEARPRGSGSFHFSRNGPSQAGNSNVSKGFLPALKKNLEAGSTSTQTESQSEDNNVNSSKVGIPTLQSSNPAVRAILEHLDRSKPTRKEKSAELQLAAEWKKPSSSRVPDAMLTEGTHLRHLEAFDFHKNRSVVEKGSFAQETDREKSNLEVKPPERSTSEATEVKKDIETPSTLNGSNDSQIKWTNETPSFRFTDSREKGTNQLWPLQNQSQGQGIAKPAPNFAGSQLPKRPPFHPSGTKTNLASISINKPSFGFTFPVSPSSGVLPEPPTPSFMPSNYTSALPQPKDEPEIPSYSFGTKRSTPPLVFSFPTTSAASVQDDTPDIKFSFGSDGKNRISFRSVGKDAICY